jgi:hypothetical protein
VYVAPQGTLKLKDSSIDANASGSWGGGIYSRGSVEVWRSTISRNTALQLCEHDGRSHSQAPDVELHGQQQ